MACRIAARLPLKAYYSVTSARAAAVLLQVAFHHFEGS
jgi:hypothetical protein